MLTRAVIELELGGLGSRHVIELKRRTTGYQRAITLWCISAGRQQSNWSGHRRTNVVKSLEQIRLAASVEPVHRSHRKETLPVGTLYEGTLKLLHRRRLHGKLHLVAIGPIVLKGELAKHCTQHFFHCFEKIYQRFSLIIDFKQAKSSVCYTNDSRRKVPNRPYSTIPLPEWRLASTSHITCMKKGNTL